MEKKHCFASCIWSFWSCLATVRNCNAFKTKFEIYFAMPFYAIPNPSFIKLLILTVPLCNTGHNAEQSKGILIFKMLSSAFPLPLVAYTVLEHMSHAKLSGFIFSVE